MGGKVDYQQSVHCVGMREGGVKGGVSFCFYHCVASMGEKRRRCRFMRLIVVDTEGVDNTSHRQMNG